MNGPLAAHGPTIIAQRPDRLGARLMAMLNAWSIAEALGLRFRFVWHRGDDPELDNPHELFTTTFLEAFEINPAALVGTVAVPGFRPETVTAQAARQNLAIGANLVVDINECFNVLAFRDEDPARARTRFLERFRGIGWSTASQAVVERVAHWPNDEGCAAIHVRAGDVITGGWRHFLAHDKYTPTPLVDRAIETLSGPARRPVLLLSDNEDYMELLRRRHQQTVRAPRDIFAQYDDLSDIHRALADVLLMSRCRLIVAPARSAFSRLAAHLGSREIVPAHTMLPETWTESEFSRRGVADQTSEQPSFGSRTALLTRDRCWYYDVFGETLPAAQQRALLDRAVDLEPDFCGALARSARGAALAGDHVSARRTAQHAVQVAETVECHSDPLVEGLATSITVGCLALAEDPEPHRAVKLAALRQMLASCEGHPPYQMDYAGILLNLHYQIAAVEWLVTTNVRRAIVPERGRSDRLAWRAASLDCLRTTTPFDPVVRDLERVTIQFSEMLAEIIAEAPPFQGQDSDPPLLGSLDEVWTSTSGLQWVRGWATDGDHPVQAIAVRQGNRLSCGGPVFLPRPDVAEHLLNPALAVSGFALPVPLRVSIHPGGELAQLVALTASGAVRRFR